MRPRRPFLHRFLALLAAIVVVSIVGVLPALAQRSILGPDREGGLPTASLVMGPRPVVESSTARQIGVADSRTAAANEADSLALVALFEATGGPGWSDAARTGWLTGRTCSWAGVACDDSGRVIQLTLLNAGLAGALPADFFNLDRLERLWIRSNPGLVGPIPDRMGGFPRLNDLRLDGNSLTGSIPGSVSVLPALGELWLEGNHLSGDIPPSLGSLAGLRVLRLGANALTGAIPASLGNLGELETLYLFDNQLTGAIPDEIGNLSALTWLGLDGNGLSGSVPSTLGNLVSLRFLNLERNALAGEIPASLGALSSVLLFSLFDNAFSGPIPPELGNLRQVEFFSLRRNQLSGSIPSELGGLGSEAAAAGTYQRRVNLAENQLSGTIPPELSGMVNTSQLMLFENRLTGPIPAQLGQMPRLTYLDLADNELTGEIPAALGMLSALRVLILFGNRLEGDFPGEVAVVPTLAFALLDDNELTGLPDIPSIRTSALSLLTVQNNRLLPDDLEANVAAADSFAYNPQASFGAESTDEAHAGASVTLTFGEVPGAFNRYQWYRDEEPVPGATRSELHIPAVNPADSGAYRLRVTNDVLPALELNSAVRILRVVGSPPVAEADLFSLQEDTTEDIPVLANDRPVLGVLDTNSLRILMGAYVGEATVVDGTIRYKPAADFFGSDSLKYSVANDSGLMDSAWVWIRVDPMNDAPVAVADTAGAFEATPVAISVLLNDRDVEMDPLQVVAVSTPANGTATFDAETITYTSRPGFNGRDEFSYTISDPSGATSQVAVVIEVSGLRFGIEPLPTPDGFQSTAYAIDEEGNVAGAVVDADGITRPALWTADGLTLLGPDGTVGQALDVSGGSVVGIAVLDSLIQAVQYAGSAMPASLGAFGSGFSAAYATGGGRIVGASMMASEQMVAVSFSGGAPRALDVEGRAGEALGLSPDGTVVGWLESAGVEVPFSLGGSSLRILNTAGEGGRAFGAGPDGSIVGRAGGSGAHWSADGTLTPLTEGAAFLDAYAVNRRGWIVGVGAQSTGKREQTDRLRQHASSSRRLDPGGLTPADATARLAAAGGTAALWLSGAGSDLNDRVSAGSGWTLVVARDINDRGVVVGAGMLDGRSRAYRLAPTTDVFPTARVDLAQVESGSRIRIPVLANDDHAPGALLSVVRIESPTVGSAELVDGGVIEYLAPTDYSGTVSFWYRVSDGRGGYAKAEVRVQVDHSVPTKTVLQPNYPNPFSGRTTIAFGLSEPAAVSVEVFDVLGRRVAHLSEATLREGMHSLDLDMTDQPPGTYFYRLRAGRFAAVRSMVLLH